MGKEHVKEIDQGYDLDGLHGEVSGAIAVEV
jgi:hypothetical protein